MLCLELVYVVLTKQLRDERDGDNGSQGGDEGGLGDERWITPILEAEHGAEASHWHGDDHGVDVVDHIVDTTYLEEEVDGERYHGETEQGGDVYLGAADNVSQR